MVMPVPTVPSVPLASVWMAFVVKAPVTALAKPVLRLPRGGPMVNVRMLSTAKILVMFAPTKVPLPAVPMACAMEREVAEFTLMAPPVRDLSAVETMSMATPRV